MASKLTAAQREALLKAGVAALPQCWGQRVQNCSEALFKDPMTFSAQRCRDIAYGYVGDWDRFQKVIDSVPYCDEYMSWKMGLLGVGIGGVLGFLVARVVKR